MRSEVAVIYTPLTLILPMQYIQKLRFIDFDHIIVKLGNLIIACLILQVFQVGVNGPVRPQTVDNERKTVHHRVAPAHSSANRGGRR